MQKEKATAGLDSTKDAYYYSEDTGVGGNGGDFAPLIVKTGGRCGTRGTLLSKETNEALDCAALAEGAGSKAFTLGKNFARGRCYAETLDVTDDLKASWFENREGKLAAVKDPQCPGGAWADTPDFDFYLVSENPGEEPKKTKTTTTTTTTTATTTTTTVNPHELVRRAMAGGLSTCQAAMKEISDAIPIGREASQSELYEAFQVVRDCESQKKSAAEDIRVEGALLAKARAAHIACRKEEETYVDEHDKCNKTLTTRLQEEAAAYKTMTDSENVAVPLTACSVTCKLTTETQKLCQGRAVEIAQEVSGYFLTKKAGYQLQVKAHDDAVAARKKKKAECEAVGFLQKKGECDTSQVHYEERLCSKLRAQVKANEEHLKAQWQALDILRGLQKEMTENNGTLRSGADMFCEKLVDTEHLDIDYPEVPQIQSCLFPSSGASNVTAEYSAALDKEDAGFGGEEPPKRAAYVVYKNRKYAALDWTATEQRGIGCQQSYKALPSGWELAPQENDIIQNVVAKHPWGTHCVVLAKGGSYCAKHYSTPGNNCGGNTLATSGSTYKPSGCHRRVLIRQTKKPKVPTTAPPMKPSVCQRPHIPENIDCTVTDKSRASSVYPCKCGNSTCGDDQLCDAATSTCSVKPVRYSHYWPRWDTAKQTCANKGKRLCRFEEVCSEVGAVPFIDGSKRNYDSWVPIDCGSDCAGNCKKEVVQIGSNGARCSRRFKDRKTNTYYCNYWADWQNNGHNYGFTRDTLCCGGEAKFDQAQEINQDSVKSKFTWKHHEIVRVHVPQDLHPSNLVKACGSLGHGFAPLCDGRGSFDGSCILLTDSNWWFRMDANRKAVASKEGLNVSNLLPSNDLFFYYNKGTYPARTNGVNNNNAWQASKGNPKAGGDTLCSRYDHNLMFFTWRGRFYKRTTVDGEMTNANIVKACSRLGARWKPPCGYTPYADSTCDVVTTDSRYLSYDHHEKQLGMPVGKMIGAHFYAGNITNSWPFYSPGTSRAAKGTMDADSYCVEHDPSKFSFTWRGHTLLRTPVVGFPNGKALIAGCAKLG